MYVSWNSIWERLLLTLSLLHKNSTFYHIPHCLQFNKHSTKNLQLSWSYIRAERSHRDTSNYWSWWLKLVECFFNVMHSWRDLAWGRTTFSIQSCKNLFDPPEAECCSVLEARCRQLTDPSATRVIVITFTRDYLWLFVICRYCASSHQSCNTLRCSNATIKIINN